MEIKQNVNIHNRFDVHIDNIETGEHREFVGYNIILDQMWTRLCSGDAYFGFIHFGSGTGTPTPDRTSLFSPIGWGVAVTEEIIKALPVSSWKRKIVLNPDEFVGQTITEVGIATSSGTNSLVTHAMLKDAEGNPISFEKTSTDIVTIYATVFVTLVDNPLIKWIGLPAGNQLINYLTGDTAPSGSFALRTIDNSYSILGASTQATWTSDIPNRKRKTNTARFGVASGNGHVKYLDFGGLFRLQLPAPGIFSGQPYAGVNVGSGDGVKKSFILPSANIRQNSLVIKKNGVTVSDYIINIKNQESNSRIANPSIAPTNIGYGVALNHDGTVMAVAHGGFPYITTYDLVEGAWVKRPNPASLPTYDAYGVALNHDGTVMAVAHGNSPYITTYDWTGGEWVKRPDPVSSLPGIGYGVALNHDGTVMAVAHAFSPYVTTYDWVNGEWVKRPDPEFLPPRSAYGVALTHDGTVMAVAHENYPCITMYDWIEGEWIKRPDPVSSPTGTSRGVALSNDGAIIAVAHTNSPYITTYVGLPFIQITFDTPPALGDAITADYIVDGVHKTDQYVIDVSCAIQFGEGDKHDG